MMRVRKDSEYQEMRNALIPKAEAAAYAAFPKFSSSTWAADWNRVYLQKMHELSVAAGLVRP